jgi:hypothetical protein
MYMKFKFFRFAAICLVAILSLTFFVQSSAFAKEADEGGRVDPRIEDFTPGRPGPAEVLVEASKPSVGNPEGSQPRAGQTIDGFLNEQRNKEIDSATKGRDVSRDNAAGESQERSRREGKSPA